MTAAQSLEELIRGCGHSALHLEMRDGYMRSDPGFAAWRQGFRHDPADRGSWWSAWAQLVADQVGHGVRMRRARIVSEPLSDYMRYEYDVTFTNVNAGEEVRWLPRRQASDLALPGNDFWLLDESTVVFLHFTGEGEVPEHDDIEVIETRDTVELCRAAFEAVWQRAVPHEKYHPA
ncbi:hypothetical protein RIF23_10485 [Lipingzhangella sp. LS1_29]|uniref:DUF6879 domain-containing protein n=1 Tax=Lipingzhangella rawalii TaxID=2055835 RepID=A0ABU2H615_9ACTN|nr:DUF6879 family protein [Lipingzhangella rawalii]MDS1270726.1 hypothetical protein [Lipingzhangella rawalii]